jgi:hypothetical protein
LADNVLSFANGRKESAGSPSAFSKELRHGKGNGEASKEVGKKSLSDPEF